MALVIYAPFESNFNIVVPATLAPAFVSGSTLLDTSNFKCGANCLGHNSGGGVDIEWYPNMPGFPDNVGAIGFWIKTKTAQNVSGYVSFQRKSAGAGDTDSAIKINYEWGATYLDLTLRMWDSSGVIRVNKFVSGAYTPDTNWHYILLNWKWNDPTGKSEVFFDEVSKISETGGNSYSRDGSQIGYLQIIGYTWPTNGDYIFDELMVFDERQSSAIPDCIVLGGRMNTINSTMVNLGMPFHL